MQWWHRIRRSLLVAVVLLLPGCVDTDAADDPDSQPSVTVLGTSTDGATTPEPTLGSAVSTER